MKTFNKKMVWILFMIGFVILEMPMAASAEDVHYAVRAMIPANQVDKNQTYFDLFMKPKQQQVINVEIFNKSNQKMDIDSYITNPMTNRNGLIIYSNIKTKLDESLKIPITDVAFIDKKRVTVPAKKSIIIPIRLQMPEKKFDGMILGGIYFENHIVEKEPPKEQITNKYTYVIGLKLTETKTTVTPKLHLISVKPGLVNYHTAVIANIQNSAPVIVDDLILNANVYNAKDEKINHMDVDQYRMAPNSNMDFAIDWKNKRLSPGKYTLKLHAETGDQNWNWTKEFVIPGQDAKELNKEAVEITPNYTWYLIIGLLIIILILLYIIFRLVKRNNQQILKK